MQLRKKSEPFNINYDLLGVLSVIIFILLIFTIKHVNDMAIVLPEEDLQKMRSWNESKYWFPRAIQIQHWILQFLLLRHFFLTDNILFILSMLLSGPIFANIYGIICISIEGPILMQIMAHSVELQQSDCLTSLFIAANNGFKDNCFEKQNLDAIMDYIINLKKYKIYTLYPENFKQAIEELYNHCLVYSNAIDKD